MEKLLIFNLKELKLTEISALKRTQITVNSRNLELVFFVERRVPRFVNNSNMFELCISVPIIGTSVFYKFCESVLYVIVFYQSITFLF